LEILGLVSLAYAGTKIKLFGLAATYLFEFWDLEHFEHTNG
jgi:hypothetical protein